MCMLVVDTNMFVSSCGVRKLDVGLLWLCMHIIDVSDVSTHWYYFGHYGVGLYCMVCGGMVARVCISPDLVSTICCGVQSLWLIMRMVVVLVSSLDAILAHWMAFTAVL